MDDENAVDGDDEVGFRRNQVLMFGVVLLGVLAITLAVSMPSDMEFNDSHSAIPSSPMNHNPEDQHDTIPRIISRNQTINGTIPTNFFKNPEDSVESKILRNIAIHKAIQGMTNDRSNIAKDIHYERRERRVDINSNEEGVQESGLRSKVMKSSNKETDRVNHIVQTFVDSEDFEDFIIDVEINDAIKKLRREKGYKKRQNTIFDDLFKQIEKQFLGDDPEEVRIVRRVGEEMERRAREIIVERKKNKGEDASYEEELIAGELYLNYESKYVEEEDIIGDEGGSASGNESVENVLADSEE